MNKSTYIFGFKSTFYLLATNYVSWCSLDKIPQEWRTVDVL